MRTRFAISAAVVASLTLGLAAAASDSSGVQYGSGCEVVTLD